MLVVDRMKMRLQQAFFNSSQGPQQREIGFPISTGNASWGGAPTQRISKRNSTSNASWGVGPNTEADEKSAYDNVQVGAG
ncbi:TPA: hypothetical protein PQH72_002279, partial [Staphylococcus aureus]|nr:hypothetical protein [Staphylococcus aureus]HDA5085676.1 hypothetical protein [Staphylococcus aureus]HDE4534158.1 hypothetical protein [Staphylococcus aureus]HDE6090045.1 hypothetical protein [Staphylococcus aureus]HDE7009532.1 hypothetical protein [Staphylococcus aureus]